MKTLQWLHAAALTTVLALSLLPAPAAMAQDSPNHASDGGPALSGKPVLHKAEATDAPLSTKVKEVRFYAVVRDKKGTPVDSLTAKDFVLEQDARPQSVSELTPKSDAPLVFGVIAETSPGQRKAMAEERSAATAFVKQLRENTDRAFVLHFDTQVELLQDVTADRDRLARGIDAISIGDQTPGARGRHRDDPDTDRPRYFLGGSTLFDAVYLAASEVLKDIPGRKAMIVFSDGRDRSSKVSLREAMEAAQHAGVAVYCVYVPSERESMENGSPEGGRQRRGGIGFPGGGGYPGGGGGYPGGGQRRGGDQPNEKERIAEGKKNLEQIAQATGGRMFEMNKKTTAAEVYNAVGEDLHHQYAIAYKPDRVEVGSHKLKVSVKNTEMKVQTPQGFLAE